MHRLLTIQSVRHNRVGRFAILVMGVVMTLSSCHDRNQVQLLYGEAQGTYYSIQYYDEKQRNLQTQIDSLLNDFDQTASLWVDSSLIRRVNRNETNLANPLLADLLCKSLDITAYTEGAFDCRIGKLVQCWGFSFAQQKEPDDSTLSELLHAAHARVYLNGDTIVKECSNTELDFNAIAQGYSSDLVGRMLTRYGIDNYLVDIGGEVVAKGSKPNGSPWRVGIERPAKNKDANREVQLAIALRNASVVTSGNYRKYYERDGIRYSHTINPANGKPVQHSLLSVSVVEQESWLADAMATAYMVMGLDSALSFINQHRGEKGTSAVYFIYDDHGSMATYATSGFEQLIISQ